MDSGVLTLSLANEQYAELKSQNNESPNAWLSRAMNVLDAVIPVIALYEKRGIPFLLENMRLDILDCEMKSLQETNDKACQEAAIGLRRLLSQCVHFQFNEPVSTSADIQYGYVLMAMTKIFSTKEKMQFASIYKID